MYQISSSTRCVMRQSLRYHCDLQVSVDTACSSALVGAHLGMQHLRSHRGAVLAAGVNLMLAETTTAAAQIAGMLTLDGRCKTMDAAADGYVRHAPRLPSLA